MTVLIYKNIKSIEVIKEGINMVNALKSSETCPAELLCVPTYFQFQRLILKQIISTLNMT